MASRDDDDDYVPASKSGEKRAAAFGGSLRLPEGLKRWKKTEGKHTFRFVPYVVGEHNQAAGKGKRFHTLTYWEHQNVGPDQERVLCEKKTKGFSGECAVCDVRAKMVDAGADDATLKSLAPKERAAFLVLVDGGDEVELYEDSYHAFAKALDKAIELGDDGEFDRIAHPDEGRLAIFRFEESSIGKGQTWTCTEAVNLGKAADPLSKRQRNHEFCLDEMLVRQDYDAVADMLGHVGHKKAAARDDDEPPRKRKPLDDDDEPPRKRASDDDEPPRKRKPLDDDDEPPRKRASDDDEPPRKRKPLDDDDEPPRKRASDDDEPPRKRKPLDDDDEPPRKRASDDDEPPRKRASDDDEPPRKRASDDDEPPRKRKPLDDDDWDKPRK